MPGSDNSPTCLPAAPGMKVETDASQPLFLSPTGNLDAPHRISAAHSQVSSPDHVLLPCISSSVCRALFPFTVSFRKRSIHRGQFPPVQTSWGLSTHPATCICICQAATTLWYWWTSNVLVICSKLMGIPVQLRVQSADNYLPILSDVWFSTASLAFVSLGPAAYWLGQLGRSWRYKQQQLALQTAEQQKSSALPWHASGLS